WARTRARSGSRPPRHARCERRWRGPPARGIRWRGSGPTGRRRRRGSRCSGRWRSVEMQVFLLDGLGRPMRANATRVLICTDAGRDVAYETGGFSFGLRHLRPSRALQRARAQIEAEVGSIHARADLDDAAKERAIVGAVDRHQKPLEREVFAEALSGGNPLA